jgi:hypothetical protein
VNQKSDDERPFDLDQIDGQCISFNRYAYVRLRPEGANIVNNWNSTLGRVTDYRAGDIYCRQIFQLIRLFGDSESRFKQCFDMDVRLGGNDPDPAYLEYVKRRFPGT